MQSAVKQSCRIILGLFILLTASLEFKTIPTVTVTRAAGASAEVPAQGRGQKKVVLKNLGMT